MDPWIFENRFYYHETPWVTFFGEHYLDRDGRRLEYYRVEKAASVIVLPLQNRRVFATPRQFRPGVARATLDFPGGRVDAEAGVKRSAERVLERELGVPPAAAGIELLHAGGLLLNSSFSDQKLYGAVARISPEYGIDADAAGGVWSLDGGEIEALLAELECAQCRLVLLEFLRSAG
jgi:8-oxo-dGTP pyrophosphatase MutT (NUDIX family)